MDRPFVFLIADGASSALGGAGWCYWKEGVFYEDHFWAGRQVTNISEMLAIYMALITVPYGAEVLLWTDSKFCVEVLSGEQPVSNPDLRRLRATILYMLDAMDCHVVAERVKSAENGLHHFVDLRARSQARLANIRHERGEL